MDRSEQVVKRFCTRYLLGMNEKSTCGVTVASREEILRRMDRCKKGSVASIGERLAAKKNANVSNKEGRLSAIEVDAHDPSLLLRRPGQ